MLRRLLPLVLIVTACSKPVDLKREEALYEDYLNALPELKAVPTSSPLTLKVLYVENPHLQKLDAAARQRVYASVASLAKQIYGYTLNVTEVKQVTIRDYFANAAASFKKSPIRFPALAFLIPWRATDRDARVAEAIAAALKKHKPSKLEEYLGQEVDALSATRVFLQKLGTMYDETAADKKPLLSAQNMNEEPWFSYGHWSTVLQGEKDYDFILTNIGIIGADNGMPLYVIARGGVTSAFVENSAHRPYQGVGVLGLYPFLADTAYFNRERGALTEAQKEEAIAWLWLHELGHLLLKKEENYDFVDSVHRAPPNLRYYDWVKRVRSSKNHHSSEIGQMKKF